MRGNSHLALREEYPVNTALRDQRIAGRALWRLDKPSALIANQSPAKKLAYARGVQPNGDKPSFFCVGAEPLLWPLSLRSARANRFSALESNQKRSIYWFRPNRLTLAGVGRSDDFAFSWPLPRWRGKLKRITSGIATT
jgi:hypothetical protein